MMKPRTTSKAQRGFTLVETLVAITILMIAIVAPYYSIQQAIVTSYAARDQLIASQLAQEGAEFIQFERDTNYLSGNNWLTGFNDCLVNSNPYGCSVDPSLGTMYGCPSAGCAPLALDAMNRYRQVGGATPTRFTRTVTMESVSANEVKVTVTVTWVTARRSYNVRTVDHLYNWL